MWDKRQMESKKWEEDGQKLGPFKGSAWKHKHVLVYGSYGCLARHVKYLSQYVFADTTPFIQCSHRKMMISTYENTKTHSLF